jgi:hypothetical protein
MSVTGISASLISEMTAIMKSPKLFSEGIEECLRTQIDRHLLRPEEVM